jgi:tetratricopeptide (TPR) repeat protein
MRKRNWKNLTLLAIIIIIGVSIFLINAKAKAQQETYQDLYQNGMTAYLVERNYEKAIGYFEQCLALNPKNKQEKDSLTILVAYLQKDYQRAITAYLGALESISRENPNKEDVIFLKARFFAGLGECYSLIENNDEALKYLNSAIELEEKEPHFKNYYLRANVFKKLDKSVEALTDYDKSVELNPDLFPQSYHARALIKMSLNDEMGAIDDIEKALSLYAQLDKLYSKKTEDYEKALLDQQSILKYFKR